MRPGRVWRASRSSRGKAGRTGRGIPAGDRRRGPAGRRPAQQAGLPREAAGIHPRLSPPDQVLLARHTDGLDTRPRTAGRYGPVPAPQGPEDKPAAGRASRRGTVARARAARATVALAPGDGRQPDEGMPACRQRAALSEGSVMAGRPRVPTHCPLLRKSGFRDLFHALPENRFGRNRDSRLL